MHRLNLLWQAQNEEVWVRRQRRLKSRYSETIEEMPEDTFVQQFRMNKTLYLTLCEELRGLGKLKGSYEIPIELKILCALSFFATGSYQRIVGVSTQLTQRTVSRCISQVVEALNHSAIIAKWIKFPHTQQDRDRKKQEFHRRFGLPGVIGCIDCTHISLVRPTDNEHLYFNRKGYHSLNVEMVCDSDLQILNVNAKFGGASHDSHIWSTSTVEAYMRELHLRNEQVWLLGDSGYPQRPWLMTPILNAVENSRKHVYMRRHMQARNCIVRCFGLLKARWRCLLRHRVLHYHPHVAGNIITACCVLHNMVVKARLPPPTSLPAEQEDDNDDTLHSSISTSTANTNDVVQGRAMLVGLLSRL